MDEQSIPQSASNLPSSMANETLVVMARVSGSTGCLSMTATCGHPGIGVNLEVVSWFLRFVWLVLSGLHLEFLLFPRSTSLMALNRIGRPTRTVVTVYRMICRFPFPCYFDLPLRRVWWSVRSLFGVHVSLPHSF